MSDNFTVTFVLDANDTGLREALTRNADANNKLTATLNSVDQAGRRSADGLQQTRRAARDATNEVQPLTNAMNQLRSAVAGYLGLQGLQSIGRQADAYANMNAQLRVAIGQTGDFSRAQADVFGIAQRTSTELGVVTGLYARLSNSLRDVGISQREVGILTERIGQAFAVSGATAAESAGAIRQLTQAFASGVLRGEEFNSVNEQGPRIMQALANSMGVTRGALRAMAEEGELTSDRLKTALLGIQGDEIAREFAQLPITIGRAWTQLGNAFTQYIGQADQATGASRILASILLTVAENLDVLVGIGLAAATLIGGTLLLSLRAATAAWLQKQAAALSAAAAMQAANASMAGTTTVAGASALALGGMATAARALSVALGPIAIVTSLAAMLLGFADATEEVDAATRSATEAINAAAAANYASEPARIAAIAGAREEARAAMEAAEATLELARAKAVDMGVGYLFWTEKDRAAANEAESSLNRLRTLVQQTDAEFGNAAVNGVRQFFISLMQVKTATDAANYTDVIDGLRKSVTALEAQRIGLTQGAEAAMRYRLETELGVAANSALGDEAEQLLQRFGSLTSTVQGLTASKRETAKASKEAAKAESEWRDEIEGLAAAVLVDDSASRLLKLGMAMEEAARRGNPRLVEHLARAYEKLALEIEKTELEATATRTAMDALLDPVQELLESYNREASLIGLSVEVRRRAEAGIRAESEARRALDEAAQKGIVYTRQEREEIVATARARAEGIVEMERMAAASEDSRKRIEEAFFSIGDAVGEVFRGNIDSAGEFFDYLGRAARDAVADMITEFFKLQVLQPILNGLFGGGGGGGFGALAGALLGSGSGGGGNPYAGAAAQAATGSLVRSGIGSIFTGGSAAASAGTSSGNSWGSAFAGSAGKWLMGLNTTLTGFGSGLGAGLTGTAWTSGQLAPGFVGPVQPGYSSGAWAGNVGMYAAGATGAYYGLTNRGERTGDFGSLAAGASYGALGIGAAGAVGGAMAGTGAVAGATGAFASMGAAAWVPVVGWILAIVALVDMISGGKVFGTRWKPDDYRTTVGVGQEGGTARFEVVEERQRALFRGREWRSRDLDVPEPLQDQADAFYRGIMQMHRQSAIALGRESTELAPIIEGSFTQLYDKGKEQKLKEEFGEMLGRVFHEPMEQFAQRLTGANLLSSIAMSLSADMIGEGRWEGYAGDGSTTGGGGGNRPGGPAGSVKATLDEIAKAIDDGQRNVGDRGRGFRETVDQMAINWDESFSALMAIAVRWDATGEQFLQGAQFLMAAAVDMLDGNGLLGSAGTLEQIADLTEEYQSANETLIQTYQRLVASTQLLEFATALAGTGIDGTREQFVRLAADIVEVAGGLERASSLWQRFFEGFYAQSEILEQQLSQATDRRDSMAADLGIDGDMGLEEFRRLFEEEMPNLTAAQIVQWLELADAMLTVEEINQALAESARDAAEDSRQMGSEFYEAVYTIIQGANEAAEAAREQGASEGELALIHLNASRRVAQAISILRAQTQDLISQLYGGVPGTLGEVERQIREIEGSVGDTVGGGSDAVSSSLRNLFEQWRRGLEQVRGWLDDVLLNTQLTTLTPQQQLQEAGQQFYELLARAQAGDADALGALPGAANQYLGLARGFFSSGDDYTAIFNAVMGAMQQAGALPNPGGTGDQPGGGGTYTVLPSPELIALYEQRDALMAEQTEAYRAQLALDLAQHINDLAGAIGVPVFELLEAMGVNLEQLAIDMGVNLDELTGESVQALATMAGVLGVSLTDLTEALGLELTDLSAGVAELAASIGIDLTNMTVESTRSLAALAASLGVDLSELTESLGLDLGDLADSQSLLNQALEAEISGLPQAQRDQLQPLLEAITNATNEADANAAIGLLEDAVADLSPDLQDRLAPYLEGIVPNTQSADVRELVTANSWLSSMDDMLYDSLQVLREIRDGMAAGTNQAAAGIHPFQNGAQLITQSGLANIHAGEGVVDPQAWSYLRSYGIQVSAQGGGPYDAAIAGELAGLRADARAHSAALVEEVATLNERVSELEERAREQRDIMQRELDRS